MIEMKLRPVVAAPVARLALIVRAVVLLGLALCTFAGSPAGAHGASAGDKPVVTGVVTLQHLRASEVISLFARESLPRAAAKPPRAAHAGTEESLLPSGIEGLLQTGEARTVALVGRDDQMPRLHDCLRVLDVPVETTTAGRQRVVLQLQQANVRALRAAILRLPGRGTAVANAHQLVLEGSLEWLHQALRQVIRAELQVPLPGRPPTL
jgi:hypothetical protein